MKYPLHRPVIGEGEIDAVVDVLRSGNLVYGQHSRHLEQDVAEHFGFNHGVAVSSGTSALHVSLSALESRGDGEVVVPAFSFPATANVVELSGLKTRFADISESTWSVTDETVRAAATEQTRGVILVHPFGMPAPLTGLQSLANREGWWLIQDAACILGSRPEVFGPAFHQSPCCLSFHPRKVLTTGEGGMILTQDERLAQSMRQWMNHGMDMRQAGWQRFTQVGFNYRMTDIGAAMGRVQIARLDDVVGQRRAMVEAYIPRIDAMSGVHLMEMYRRSDVAMQSFVVTLDPAIDRDGLIAWLGEEGIGTTLGGYAIHLQPAFVDRYGDLSGQFPNAERLYRTSLTLPITHGMSAEDVDVICATLERGIEIHG